MSCNFGRPWIDKYGNRFKQPCHKCMGCRIDARENITKRMTYEVLNAYHNGYEPSFVTFTYDDPHLPRDGSLSKKEMVLLRDRLRHDAYNHSFLKPGEFKMLCVGEYGDELGRAHYHCVFPNLPYDRARILFGYCWRKGSIKCLPLLNGGIRYCLKYMDKQVFGDDEIKRVYGDSEPPFRLVPNGLGKDVYSRRSDEIYEHGGLWNRGRVEPLNYYQRKCFGAVTEKHKQMYTEQELYTHHWLAERRAMTNAIDKLEPVDMREFYSHPAPYARCDQPVSDTYSYKSLVKELELEVTL